MSNHLAIGTVTATLRHFLQAVLDRDFNGARVTSVRPTAQETGLPNPGVNVFLYNVTPNAAWRNADLPTRRSGDSLVQRPVAALDLHYLLTFHGADAEFAPQRVLGAVVRAVHSTPILTRAMVQQAVVALGDLLADSDLSGQVEAVRLSPGPLSLEDLSRLWSGILQLPFYPSLTYQAGVVLIESTDAPQPALPVRDRRVYALPIREPRVERILSHGAAETEAVAQRPISLGDTVVLEGRSLRGEITEVRLGDAIAAPTEVTDTALTFRVAEPPFAAGSLRAGVLGVQVVHSLALGSPPEAHRGSESVAMPLVLRPRITSVSMGGASPPAGRVLNVTVSPPIAPEQRVRVLLNEIAPPPGRPARAFMLPALTQPQSPTDPTVVRADADTVPAGSYVVRVQVDGAESLLERDADERYSTPEVTLP